MTVPVSIPRTEVFELNSTHADEDYQIWIAAPVPGVMPLPDGPRRAFPRLPHRGGEILCRRPLRRGEGGREESVSAALDDLDTSLFLAVGGNEERADIPTLAPFKMVSNLQSFAAQLRSRAYLSLELETFVAEGESHTSVVPVAMTRGLRYLLRIR